jgi:hypothetical protein
MKLVQRRTIGILAEAADRLDREWSELQKLRDAVAEAERSNPERQHRPEARPLS